jgi:predicted alpha-1,2-mannosidase
VRLLITAKVLTIFASTGCLLGVPLQPVLSQSKSRLPVETVDEIDLTEYVNPFIGTEGYGNTFPGPTLPFGMMQWSPDTTSNGFYKYHNATIRGFSLTHLSGAGCPAYADIPFLPTVAPIDASPATNLADYTSTFSHSNERAAPGYYSAKLNSGIQVSLSVTARTGFGVFSYPPSQQANLLINAGGSATGNTIASVEIVGDKEVVGSAMSGGFCGSTSSYVIYFAAQFDRPFKSFGTWNAATVTPNLRSSIAKQAGAILTFDTAREPAIKVKVGISFVSIENARLNLSTENTGWSFDAVRRKASATWNDWLGRILIDGGSREQKEMFYTALYHALISPNVFTDVNGEYVGFDRLRHTARGYTHYSNISDWDIYRTLVQLHALLAPRQTSDIVQSLVVDALHSGWLPKWPLANDVTSVMGGDSPVALITTAYAFGAKDFDTGAALRFMLKGATVPGTGIHGYTQRPRLAEYLQRGYVPLYSLGLDNDVVGSASVTLEYANDDFAVAQFAQALGNKQIHRIFMRRAQTWQNIFDAEIGFIRPRHINGVFLKGFDPDAVLPQSEVPWDKSSQAGFQEGSTCQYTWMIPYNYSGLFQAIGGKAEVVRRLDKFFAKLSGWGTPYFNIANEPSFVAPYAYTFAGSPWRTQRVVRRIMTETFNATPGGLPGNDDLGATSAWYIWSAIGLYPAIPGVGGFIISSPSFSSIAIRLGDAGLAGGQLRLVSSGRQIRIVAQEAPVKHSYVQSLTVNGKLHTRAWLPIETIKTGLTTLRFTLTDNPETKWASSPSDAPPSFTEGQAAVIGFIYGDDSIVMQKGETATISLGMQKLIQERLIVKWNAQEPPGLSLRPSSGVVRVNENEKPRVVVQVTSSGDIAPGNYTIPIRFQASSARRASWMTLPETIIEVEISSAFAK